jgi:hypothetical protein
MKSVGTAIGVGVALFFQALGYAQSSSTIEPTATQAVGGAPGGGLIVGQTRCDGDGNLYFRQLQGAKVVLAPIVQISADGKRSHTFDFLAQASKDLASLSVSDFSISGSTLYLAGSAADGKTHILEYSTSDGQFNKAVTLDDTGSPDHSAQSTLSISKLGVMPSGELLIFGTRALKREVPNSTPTFSYSPALELYDVSGRFLKTVNFKSDRINLNDKAHSREDNFASVDLALTANGPEGVYLIAYSNKPVVYVIGPSGEISRRIPIEPIGNEFRPISLSLIKNELLVEFVKSADGSPETTFVSYNANSGEIYSTYQLDKSMNGIFSCYDGRRTFTFVSTDGLGQRVIAFGDAR